MTEQSTMRRVNKSAARVSEIKRGRDKKGQSKNVKMLVLICTDDTERVDFLLSFTNQSGVCLSPVSL